MNINEVHYFMKCTLYCRKYFLLHSHATCHVTHWCWTKVDGLSLHPSVLSGWGQDRMSLWTLLCSLVHSHVGRESSWLQTDPAKLGAWDSPECPKCHAETFRAPFHGSKGSRQLLRNNPTPNFTFGTKQLEKYNQFRWPTILWPSCCFYVYLIHLDLGTFRTDWTCCIGGIRSQVHTGIHWAPESNPFFSQMCDKNSLHA